MVHLIMYVLMYYIYKLIFPIFYGKFGLGHFTCHSSNRVLYPSNNFPSMHIFGN